MAKRYARVNFQNTPSTATPLNATNLNKLDKGVDDCDNAIEEIYTKRVNNAITTNPDTFLAGPVGKALQDQITAINDNLAKYEPTSSNTLNITESELNNQTTQGNYSVFLTSVTGTTFSASRLFLLEVKKVYYNGAGVGYVQRMTQVYPNSTNVKTRAYYSAGGWGEWV